MIACARQFLWLVRDFSLKLTANGRDISAKEYLENSLQPLDVRSLPLRLCLCLSLSVHGQAAWAPVPRHGCMVR
jgi:hypothetical protein